MPLFLDEEQVRPHLRWDELIPAMEQALIDFSAGRVEQPVRKFLTIEKYQGFFGVMPAAGESMGIKLVTVYPGNHDKGLPSHLAIIVLFRPETGEQLAVMDARLITEMRTAAVTAAATKALAPSDAKVLAILGSGVQARSHAEALPRVRSFEEVRVWSRTPANAERLASEIDARAVAERADAVRDADVVLSATSATQPVLEGQWVKPGALVNAVGWHGYTSRELDDDAMRNTVVVESREAAHDQCGDVKLSGAEIYAELGEILAGDRPRPPEGRTVVFDSVGLAIEDITAAMLVYERAAGGSR